MANTISMGTQAGSSGGWELAGSINLSGEEISITDNIDITPYREIQIFVNDIYQSYAMQSYRIDYQYGNKSGHIPLSINAGGNRHDAIIYLYNGSSNTNVSIFGFYNNDSASGDNFTTGSPGALGTPNNKFAHLKLTIPNVADPSAAHPNYSGTVTIYGLR